MIIDSLHVCITVTVLPADGVSSTGAVTVEGLQLFERFEFAFKVVMAMVSLLGFGFALRVLMAVVSLVTLTLLGFGLVLTVLMAMVTLVAVKVLVVAI